MTAWTTFFLGLSVGLFFGIMGTFIYVVFQKIKSKIVTYEETSADHYRSAAADRARKAEGSVPPSFS